MVPCIVYVHWMDHQQIRLVALTQHLCIKEYGLIRVVIPLVEDTVSNSCLWIVNDAISYWIKGSVIVEFADPMICRSRCNAALC